MPECIFALPGSLRVDYTHTMYPVPISRTYIILLAKFDFTVVVLKACFRFRGIFNSCEINIHTTTVNYNFTSVKCEGHAVFLREIRLIYLFYIYYSPKFYGNLYCARSRVI